MHGEGDARPWTGRDIRFTTKGRTLYAFALDWPEDGRMVIDALKPQAGRVEAVELLGGGTLGFRQTEAGLVVTLPSERPVTTAPAIRLRGAGLV